MIDYAEKRVQAEALRRQGFSLSQIGRRLGARLGTKPPRRQERQDLKDSKRPEWLTTVLKVGARRVFEKYCA